MGQTATVRILTYSGLRIAGSGTNSTNIYITNHGLADEDTTNSNNMIINTTRRTTTSSIGERGSRTVTYIDNNSLITNGYLNNGEIIGQTSGDNIMLFSSVNISSYVKSGTLVINNTSEYDDSCSFVLNIPLSDLRFIKPSVGKRIYVEIDDDSISGISKRFAGYIYSTSMSQLSKSSFYVTYNVTCNSLKHMVYNKIVNVDLLSGTLFSYIFGVAGGLLVDEGLTALSYTASDITSIKDNWKSNALKMGELFDTIATQAGLVWYWDEDWILRVKPENGSVSSAHEDLVDGSGFTDFFNVSISEDISNYSNDFTTVINNEDFELNYNKPNKTEIDRIQEITCGSGYYCTINRENDLIDYYISSVTSVSGDQLTVPNILSSVGDYLYNLTQDTGSYIKSIDSSTKLTLDSDSDQWYAGDTYVVFFSTNNKADAISRIIARPPKKITFTTNDINFEPQTKLEVQLDDLGITSSEYYLIENVSTKDIGGKFQSVVTASLRDNSDFTFATNLTFTNYWKNF